MTSAERYGLTLVSDPAERIPTRAVFNAEVSSGTTHIVDVAALVPAYSPLLFRVAHAVLRNRAEAEDAVQDAFLRVLAHRDRLPEVENLRVWLVRIVWRLALDRKRRITPGQMDALFLQSLVGASLPADQALAEANELELVLEEMDRLPAAERHVLLLCAQDEMKTAEIAAVLHRSESAVRALLFRARERLRQRLGRHRARRPL